MWKLQQPWWEFVLRALLVYGFLLVALRLTGKRQVGQLAPFDLVLLLVLSNTVQNSMNGGDNTVGAGFLLAGALVAVNSVVGYLTYKSKRMEALIDGKPQIIIHNGLADEAVLTKERISHHELMAAVRQANLLEISEVHLAILETNGRINVIAKK
ncbi:MAG: DUF421 domain-containing protein [Holophagaceae bacterium]|nr:DUF421 domain-containing protein [Holophagaceae bacterium]